MKFYYLDNTLLVAPSIALYLLSNLIYYIFGKGENCETCSW